MFKEFKTFLSKGNALDLAIGMIIGAAFTKIVSSLADDVITPLLSIVTPTLDFDGFAPTIFNHPIHVGVFLTSCVNFLLVGFGLFLVVKVLNKLNLRKEAAPTKTCPYCQSVINDAATRCPQCTSNLDEKETA